jgi:AcrR family transcriptional regulator
LPGVGAADPSREAAEDACRRRVAQAVAEVAREPGLGKATVAEICLRAGVSRTDFDRLFPAKEAAVRHAFAAAFDSLFDPVHEAFGTAQSWLGGLANALDALLEGAAKHPRFAELCLSYSLGDPKDSAGHNYTAAVAAISALVHVAREHAEVDGRKMTAVPAVAEEFLAHGILSRAAHIAEHDGRPTTEAGRGDLLMLVLMTFYGTEDATRMCAEVDA